MLHFARTITLLAAALWSMCAVAASPTLAESAPVESEPILRFDVIEVPAKGRVSVVTGNVERLSGNDHWVLVKPGYRLMHGDQVKVSAGATLIIKFSGKERAEFTAAPKDRWLRFQVAGRLGHDT
jgi:hypothetical protein